MGGGGLFDRNEFNDRDKKMNKSLLLLAICAVIFGYGAASECCGWVCLDDVQSEKVLGRDDLIICQPGSMILI